jgi:polysaccharide export outer membrane protein
LSAGDVLSIQLWAYPEITPPIQDATNIKAVGYPIDPNGNVQLPLVGSVHIAGKTLAETNRFLHQQFAKYLKHPDVVVRVLSYEGRRYFVNGQVMRSGQYTLNDQPISIYTALGQAGGVDTKTGDTTNIQLIRNGQTYNLNTIQLEKQGLSLHQLLIQPNDTIFVNTKQDQKLYVMGESSRSQALTLRDQGMTLSDVLGESEGISPYSASAARIYVMRTDLSTKQSTIYHLNLSSLGNLALANQFAMQKNDIVYIDATGLTRWQRIMNQVIPFSSALYSFDQLGK